jgi:hypothetical protein
MNITYLPTYLPNSGILDWRSKPDRYALRISFLASLYEHYLPTYLPTYLPMSFSSIRSSSSRIAHYCLATVRCIIGETGLKVMSGCWSHVQQHFLVLRGHCLVWRTTVEMSLNCSVVLRLFIVVEKQMDSWQYTLKLWRPGEQLLGALKWVTADLDQIEE